MVSHGLSPFGHTHWVLLGFGSTLGRPDDYTRERVNRGGTWKILHSTQAFCEIFKRHLFEPCKFASDFDRKQRQEIYQICFKFTVDVWMLSWDVCNFLIPVVSTPQWGLPSEVSSRLGCGLPLGFLGCTGGYFYLWVKPV